MDRDGKLTTRILWMNIDIIAITVQGKTNFDSPWISIFNMLFTINYQSIWQNYFIVHHSAEVGELPVTKTLAVTRILTSLRALLKRSDISWNNSEEIIPATESNIAMENGHNQ